MKSGTLHMTMTWTAWCSGVGVILRGFALRTTSGRLLFIGRPVVDWGKLAKLFFAPWLALAVATMIVVH